MFLTWVRGFMAAAGGAEDDGDGTSPAEMMEPPSSCEEVRALFFS